MARIQILELPTVYHENGDDETPFAIVIDQADEETYQALAFGTAIDADGTQHPLRESLKDHLGARAILTFAETVEIPANERKSQDIADQVERERRNYLADQLGAQAEADRSSFTCLDTVDEVMAWLRGEPK
ncbi:hypothetical protein [Streptomyces sp. NPDC048385]|uniref:hypothetical protein n=1 Tax=unclassified Streptomyces TaxID=2593676 RepID=UPI00343E2A0F